MILVIMVMTLFFLGSILSITKSTKTCAPSNVPYGTAKEKTIHPPYWIISIEPVIG